MKVDKKGVRSLINRRLQTISSYDKNDLVIRKFINLLIKMDINPKVLERTVRDTRREGLTKITPTQILHNMYASAAMSGVIQIKNNQNVDDVLANIHQRLVIN